MADYRSLIEQLAATATRRATDLAGAEQAYQEGLTAAAAELRRAEEAAAETDQRAAAAAAAVVEADREAERLWTRLHRGRGWPGHRIGPSPEPAPATAQPALDLDDGAASRTLGRVAARIDGERLAHAGGVGNPAKLPLRVPPLLPFLGAAVTAVAGLLAGGLVAVADAGIPGANVVRTLGWLAYFAAPFAGIPFAAAWVRRRWGARLDAGGVALLVLGGLWSLCAVVVVLT